MNKLIEVGAKVVGIAVFGAVMGLAGWMIRAHKAKRDQIAYNGLSDSPKEVIPDEATS
jgi:uncharacterized membrane protein